MSKTKKKFRFSDTTAWMREIDYADKLSPSERDLIRKFDAEQTGRTIDAVDPKLGRSKKKRSEYYKIQNARGADLMNARSCFSREISEDTKVASVEDALIEAIDLSDAAKKALYKCPKCKRHSLFPSKTARRHVVLLTDPQSKVAQRTCANCGYSERHDHTVERVINEKLCPDKK